MTPRGLAWLSRRVAVGLGLTLAGCAVGPNYHRPALDRADGYGAQATAPEGPGEGETLTQGQDVPAQWWAVYQNTELADLVQRALRRNPTIAAAQAALRGAREQAAAQRAAYFPTIAASLQPSHQYFARDLSSQTASGKSVYDLTTTQVTATYAPDLFGANARAVESLVALREQQKFELEAARLTLADSVVAAAVADAMLRDQIASTKLIIADQQTTYDSFVRQAELGQASQADIAAQKALLAQSQSTLPPLEKQFRINRDLLCALVGVTPAEPVAPSFGLGDLNPHGPLPLSLPAKLVEHRPDVRIAEAQLHAASAQVGVAEAARWPNLQIDANAGSAALRLAPQFGAAENFWSVAGTLTQPLFDGGMLLHRKRAAVAAYDQAAAQYRATVIGAFQNTADVLQALQADAEALRRAQAADDAAQSSLRIAQRQVALGDISRLAFITIEQTRLQARLTLLQARANRLDDIAALFQALGGGWWNDPPTARRSLG